MKGETYERYISSNICEEVGRMVYRAQRAHDCGGILAIALPLAAGIAVNVLTVLET